MPPLPPLDPSWRDALRAELDSPAFADLLRFVDAAAAQGPVYPPRNDLFAAFNRTPFDRVKVVILGQDPYHGPGQAHGLAFSVPDGVRVPPSLRNIYKELAAEYGPDFAPPRSGNLEAWADQGVLLLNNTLTVADGRPGSHQGHGWERFTDAAVTALATRRDHLVFLLWGAPARRKGAHIDRARHLVLEAAHPSPLSASRGFFGCGHFRAANDDLAAHGLAPVRW